MDETEGVPVTSSGAGLRPPAPSWVDPMGISTRPTAAPADIPVGDDADAVGEARSVPGGAGPRCGSGGAAIEDGGESGRGSCSRAHGGRRSWSPARRRTLVEPSCCSLSRPRGRWWRAQRGVVPGEVPWGIDLSGAKAGIPVGATGAEVRRCRAGRSCRGARGWGLRGTVPTWASAGPEESASARRSPREQAGPFRLLLRRPGAASERSVGSGKFCDNRAMQPQSRASSPLLRSGRPCAQPTRPGEVGSANGGGHEPRATKPEPTL